MTPNIRPLSDVVLVSVDEPEAASDVIIDVNRENTPLRKGTVLRVGPGRYKLKAYNENGQIFRPMQAKPGDRIVFFAASMGTKQGRQLSYVLPEGYGLLREEDILFVFDEDVKVSV